MPTDMSAAQVWNESTRGAREGMTASRAHPMPTTDKIDDIRFMTPVNRVQVFSAYDSRSCREDKELKATEANADAQRQ